MKSKVIPVTDLSGIAPKSVLLFERIHYGWLHPRMIDFLQRDHGARFTVLTPRNKVAEERGRQLSGDGLIVYSEDIDAGIDARAFSEKEERDIADRNEREYSVAYLRDLVQQERWISTFFVGYAQTASSRSSSLRRFPICGRRSITISMWRTGSSTNAG